jgi:hypothetical protein
MSFTGTPVLINMSIMIFSGGGGGGGGGVVRKYIGLLCHQNNEIFMVYFGIL